MAVRSYERFPFDFASLQVFLAVCDSGTMASAGRLLNMTQPAISQVVIDMEARLHVKLFDRSIRPIALTPAGVILRQRATQLFAEARQVVPELRKSRRGYHSVLKVGMVDSVTRALSMPIANLLAEVSEQVIVYSGLTAAHSTALITRQMDLVIGLDEMTESDGLERHLIMTEPYLLITQRNQEFKGLEHLIINQPMIRYSARSLTGVDIERYLRRMGLDVPRRVEFDNPFGVSARVAAGVGWAITTPLCILESGVPLNSLALHPLPVMKVRRGLYLVTREKELGTMTGEISQTSIDVLRARCYEAFEGNHPWILDSIAFGPGRAQRQLTLIKAASGSAP